MLPMPFNVDDAVSKLTSTLKDPVGCTSFEDDKVTDMLVHWIRKSRFAKKVMYNVANTAMGEWLNHVQGRQCKNCCHRTALYKFFSTIDDWRHQKLAIWSFSHT